MYLSKAEAVLPIAHVDVEGWQGRLKAVRADLLEALGDVNKRLKSGFQSKAINQLVDLKNEYIRIYSALFAKARLTVNEDKRKRDLLNDARIGNFVTHYLRTYFPLHFHWFSGQ